MKTKKFFARKIISCIALYLLTITLFGGNDSENESRISLKPIPTKIQKSQQSQNAPPPLPHFKPKALSKMEGNSSEQNIATPPCRQQLIERCAKGLIPDEAICTILKESETREETTASVHSFLLKALTLPDDLRNDLVCARLMGRKYFNRLTFFDESFDKKPSVALGDNPSVVFNDCPTSLNCKTASSGPGRPGDIKDQYDRQKCFVVSIEFAEPYAKQMRRLKDAYRTLHALKYKDWENYNGEWNIELKGDVFDASFHYKSKSKTIRTMMMLRYSSYHIKIFNAVPISLETKAGSGTFDQVLIRSEKILRDAYSGL
jgi:hypothetical protein